MSVNCDEQLTHLHALFADLPGIGPRSAMRIVTELLMQKKELAQDLAQSLDQAVRTAHHCPGCNTLTTLSVCPVCADEQRDRSILCIVESPADLAAIEGSVSYKGSYFVLMGRVNPLQGIGPMDLGVDRLLERCREPSVQEVVIATSYTPEGETTAHMLHTVLRKSFPQLRVTRLARGLPVGVEIEYTDAATLSSAVLDRR